MTIGFWPSQISLGSIRNEFGGPTAVRLGEYYAGGGRVGNGTIGYPFGNATLIPSSGQMSVGNFYGASNKKLTIITSNTVFYPVQSIAAIVVVGGGGGGGGGRTGNSIEGAGGGGAGGVVFIPNFQMTPGSPITCTIGVGGIGCVFGEDIVPTAANSGSATTFGTVVAAGGGHGGGAYETYEDSGNEPPYPIQRTIKYAPAVGGSGGGGYGYFGYQVGANGISGQGNKGGDGGEEGIASGGGGGGAGGEGSFNGPGGAPFIINLFGTNVSVAAGGGGGKWNSSHNGGSANAGSGGNQYQNGTNAAPNSGCGGGGSGPDAGRGGNGGSGIIYILEGGL